MENISTYNSPQSGGRISSPKFRGMAQLSEDFRGLPEGVTKQDLLYLVKDVGSHAGFTPRMVSLLEYYIRFTRDCDWAEDGRPIVYQSLIKTAREFNVSERQIQYLEKSLFDVGALTWDTSGSNKRYGARDARSGEIIFASGIDLSPLASLHGMLERKKAEIKLENAAWDETKRQISWYRSRIRSLLAEASECAGLETLVAEASHAYEGISGHIRAYMDLAYLRDLLKEHTSIHALVNNELEAYAKAEAPCHEISELTINTSSTDDKNFAHIYSTNNTQSLKRDTSSSPKDRDASEGSVAGSIEPKSNYGADVGSIKQDWMAVLATEKSKISWKQVLACCSERFKERFPMTGRPLNWSDIVDAAHQMLPTLGISNSAWLEACMTLGRDGAALVVVIIDQKAQDPINPIRNPGGYLRAMTARAKKGELNLHKSMFGILKRDGEKYDA